MSNKFLDIIANKRPSQLLSTKVANWLFTRVPTPANDFLWLKLMRETTSDSTEIKVTAYEPVFWVMKSVRPWTTVPLMEKLWSKTTKFMTIKFWWSKTFTEEEMLTIARAERADASDAEIRIWREIIVREMEAMKYNQWVATEKSFWEWMMGTMNVIQDMNGKISNNSIPTHTRELTTLTWDFRWNVADETTKADPVKDIRTLKRTYKWKWAKLSKILMNQETYDFMMMTPKIRDNAKYTTRELETWDAESVKLWWVSIEVYDWSYIDDDKTVRNFIPDWYIIWLWEWVWVANIWVEHVKCLNVDATDPDTLQVKAVYWSFFYVEWTRDPVSKKMTMTDYSLPVFKNPEIYCFKKVF